MNVSTLWSMTLRCLSVVHIHPEGRRGGEGREGEKEGRGRKQGEREGEEEGREKEGRERRKGGREGRRGR